MTALNRKHTLIWEVELLERGYTCLTLTAGPSSDHRWAWIINAAASGWMAQVGAFGAPCGPSEEVLPPQIKIFDDLTEAQNWCVLEIAKTWAKTDNPLWVPRP